jgi:hypothetical protein
VLPVPLVSAAPTASPRYLVPHPAADDQAPIASQPTYQSLRSASPRPRRPSLSCAQRCPLPPDAAPRCCPRRTQAPLSPSLSPALPARGAHPSGPPPSPPLPFKTEPPSSPAKFSPLRHDFPLSALTPRCSQLPHLRSSRTPPSRSPEPPLP